MQCEMNRDDFGYDRNTALSRGRRLWRILSDALHSGSLIDGTPTQARTESESESLGLIRWRRILENGQDWWRAVLNRPVDDSLHVDVQFVSRSFGVDVLAGFDNSGNVRIWAGEETLAYWAVNCLPGSIGSWSNPGEITICELAGGMCCLAGMFLAVALARFNSTPTCPVRLILTDGNERCLENVKSVIERNSHLFEGGKVSVEARVLRFGRVPEDLRGRVDLVMAADCLFDEDNHKALLESFDSLLKPSGRAYVAAPDRRGTFGRFVSMASSGFRLKWMELEKMELFVEALRERRRQQNVEKRVDLPRFLTMEKLQA